jgi:hypothetical protein
VLLRDLVQAPARWLLRQQERLLLRYEGRVPLRTQMQHREQVLLRFDERVPARGHERPLYRAPQRRLLRAPERGPRRGQELPLWSGGWEFARTKSKGKSQKAKRKTEEPSERTRLGH